MKELKSHSYTQEIKIIRSRKIKPQAKIHNFAFKNTNIVI